MRIVVVAGGVGGARFVRGVREEVRRHRPGATVDVIVNTGDDWWLAGLRIAPDFDSMLYTLSGQNDEERGWGRVGESERVSAELHAYGVTPEWFTLGDLDLGTHIARTAWLREGATPSDVARRLQERWPLGVTLHPATDEEVDTHVQLTGDAAGEVRELHFQEWWTRYRAALPAALSSSAHGSAFAAFASAAGGGCERQPIHERCERQPIHERCERQPIHERCERQPIHERYDLKGSWVQRHGSSVAELRGQRCRCRYCDRRFVVGVDGRFCSLRFNKSCVPEQQLKDNDLMYKLNLRPALAAELAGQLRADADFLASQGLMDYSLLVGVTRRRFDLQHAQPRTPAAQQPPLMPLGVAAAAVGHASGSADPLAQPLLSPDDGSRYEAEFVDGPAVYYLGIIDVLQRWDLGKKKEYVAKLLLGKNRHGISCVPPLEYAERFKRRVVEAIVEGRD